jgi:hypothetical protein
MGQSRSIPIIEYSTTEIIPPKGNKCNFYLYSFDTYQSTKNVDYYFSNKRFTKISRKLYPNDYERGLLWGYTEKQNPIDCNRHYTHYIEDEEEKSF